MVVRLRVIVTLPSCLVRFVGTGSNPGSDPFADICSNGDAIRSGFMLAAAQLAICGGPINELTDGGAQLTDCKTDPLAGAICGMGV